jgi:hypothetical protein
MGIPLDKRELIESGRGGVGFAGMRAAEASRGEFGDPIQGQWHFGERDPQGAITRGKTFRHRSAQLTRRNKPRTFE